MKKKIILAITSTILLLAIIVPVVYLLNGCQKDVDEIKLTSAYVVSGRVIDNETSLPLSNVSVICLEKSTTTNSDGIYTFNFNKLPDDFITISAKKDGYPVGTTIITLGYYCSVNIIRLMTPAVSKIIDSAGGSISVGNSESIDASQKIEVIFPAEALNSSTEISMTPLEGIAVPNISPRKTLGLLNAATVSLEPSGLELNQNVIISFPLPIQMAEGTELELLIYDENSLKWRKSGTTAFVDSTGSLAVTEINHFSTYSIGIEGDYIEEIESITQSNTPIDINNDTTYCYQATVEYPEGIPDDISPIWMKNVVSQNTELGGRVSFFEQTCIPSLGQNISEEEEGFCPELTDPPCENCIKNKYVYKDSIKIEEKLKVKWKKEGYEFINREITNEVNMVKKTTICFWDCPEDCHEGGEGN